MKNNFALCLAFTLRYEGGKANNPKDPGGRTNEGVTQRTFTAWLAKQSLRARDVYTLTPAERDAIYKTGFWNAVKADDAPPGADLALFDYGVNSGPGRALKAYAKRTSNDGATIVMTICAGRLSFLHALGTFAAFGKGWTARVMACEATGVKMAEHDRIGAPVDAPAVPQVASKLKTAAAVAAAKAKSHTKKAAATGGAGSLATASSVGHAPLILAIVLGVAALAAAALILRRAHQQTARAAAYTAVAAGKTV